jgi:two-component system, cell cycle sensor histidine kinase and response regulator CckA
MVWIDLIYNLALLVALSVVSGFVDARWKRNTRLGRLLQGVVFGSAATIGMLHPFVFAPGVVFDGRSVMVSLGALFFGPWAAAVACLMTIPLRMVQAGPGATTGVLVILASAAIGVCFHLRREIREVSVAALLGFGVVVHLAMLAMMVTLPPDMILPVLKGIGWPVMLAYPPATVLIGKILSDQAARSGFLESLRESEDRFRCLVESAPEAIFVQRQGRIVYLNPAMLTLVGASKSGELLGTDFMERMAPEYRQAIRERIDFQRETGSAAAPMDQEYLRLDGSRVPVETTAVAIGYQGGDAHLVFARDITDRKRTEAAVHLNELRLQSYIDSAGDAIYILDRTSGRILNCNTRACHDLGYDRDELLALSAADIEAGFSTGEISEVHHQLSPGEVRTIDGTHKRKDGSEFPVEIRLSSMASSDPELLIAVVRDITDRKQAEAAMRLAHDRLKRFVDSGIVGILVADPTGRVIEANDYYLRLIGATREQFDRGELNWRSVRPPEWLAADEKAI